jgi:hypothetical protein
VTLQPIVHPSKSISVVDNSINRNPYQGRDFDFNLSGKIDSSSSIDV